MPAATANIRALDAVATKLDELGPLVKVLRNSVLPASIPVDGLAILRDGEVGTPEVSMSPITYHYEHHASLELYVKSVTNIETALSTFMGTVRDLIDINLADRTLGGVVEDIRLGPPDFETPEVPAGDDVKGVAFDVILFYSCQSPIG